MKISSLIISILCASAFNSMAFQVKNNIDYLFNLSLEELLKVKVTGSTLTPKELKIVPSAVTMFTHQEINNLGLDTLDELMNLVPGFQSYRSSISSIDYPFSSRGRRIGNPGSEILILVDGTRLAEPRTSGSILIVPKYPLVQIERVEFIRGPGSAVYGSNAMMGVINIITRSNVNEMNVSYGFFNRRKGHLLTSKKIGGVTVDFFGYIDMDEGDNYRVEDTFSVNRIGTEDPRDLANLNMKLQWQDTFLNLQHSQYKVEDFYSFDNLSNGFNEESARLTIFSLKQDFDWRAIESYIRLDYARSRFTTSQQLSAPGTFAAISSPASDDALFGIADFNDNTETRILWNNDWGIKPQSSLQFGIELRHIHIPESFFENNFDVGDLTSGIIPIRYYGSLLATTLIQAASKRDIVGLYGQYQHQLFENTHLTLGLRHDDFSSIGSQLSPRFGFSAQSNFTRAFKRWTGTTPHQYRGRSQ
ncbi:hypothetical protein A9Q81_23100 [Gammaproteobacteria bacterium 42_54_T18]|nr:hypothetical protein A9Q81_23100 [Gammaproteobacteria bacterium 42_54_T18]